MEELLLYSEFKSESIKFKSIHFSTIEKCNGKL